MLMFKFLLAFIVSAALLLAQLTNNTVTATASQSATTAPDQAVMSVTVSSGLNATFEQVVNALSGVGVTSANLNSVLGSYANLQWSFRLTTPLAQLETTAAALTSLQKSISQNNSGLFLSFYVASTQSSAQASTDCNFAALLAQAGTQAQQIAGAAGLQKGSVTALNAATTACSLTATFAIPSPFTQSGPNIITIAASGASTPQNDQALISLLLTSPVTADLSDATNALTANGITGTNFTGVVTAGTTLNWSFTLTVPLSKLTATLAQISATRQTIGNQNSGLSLTFLSAYASASQTQQAAACLQATLVSGAQALAQQIATAAGVSVGQVLNISQGSSGVAGSFLLDPATIYDVSAPCTLTVQYQLL
jgi:uncharacterized protein YggE